ncbi:cytochrome P450 (plasmid) [Chondrocystis sp. NIES-4102]|nr:cytochrome P450 [Chondrocystis sp. NIES-4102]
MKIYGMLREKNNDNEDKVSFLPPGARKLETIKETIELIKDSQQFTELRSRKYGSVFKTCIFGQPMIYVTGQAGCRFVLENEDIYFQNKMLPNMESLIGKFAVTTQIDRIHHNRRKILAKAFTPKYLEEKIPIITQITAKYIERWDQHRYINWYDELQNYSLDIACKLFVGIDNGSQSELGSLYKIWSEGLFSFALPLPWTKLGRALDSRDRILAIINNLIEDRKNKYWQNDLLGILLNARDEEGNCLTEHEVKDQILNMLSAGHGTLASALCSICLLLTQNPGVLERCRQEQKVFINCEPMTINALEKMVYLEAVIKEVLRIFPPVGGGFREIIKDCEFENYYFPKGWRVIYNSFMSHKDATCFISPEKFNPDRFLELGENNYRGYFPFGGGKRRCLGENLARLEMKIFAAMIISRCEWQILHGQDLTMQQLPFPHPKDNLKVSFSCQKY